MSTRAARAAAQLVRLPSPPSLAAPFFPSVAPFFPSLPLPRLSLLSLASPPHDLPMISPRSPHDVPMQLHDIPRSPHDLPTISPRSYTTISSRSPHDLPTISPLSYTTISPRSPHVLHTISTRSQHDLHTISTRSPHDLHTQLHDQRVGAPRTARNGAPCAAHAAQGSALRPLLPQVAPDRQQLR